MPRSYSRATFTAEIRNRTRKKRTTARRPERCSSRATLLLAADRELEAVGRLDPDVGAGHECLAVAPVRLPELAVDPDLSSGASTIPSAPTTRAVVTRTGLRRTCTAFAIAKAQKAPIATVIATTSGTDVWYGAGALWNSMIIPIESAMRPATVSAPCVTTCASTTSSPTPSRISMIPTHEIGQHGEPEQRGQQRDRAERARAARRRGGRSRSRSRRSRRGRAD